MYMAFVFQIKRRLADSVDVSAPALEPGELAFDETTDTLYIGVTPTSGADISSVPVL